MRLWPRALTRFGIAREFDRNGAAIRLANIGLVLSIFGSTVFIASWVTVVSDVVASSPFLPEKTAYHLFAGMLIVFFVALAGAFVGLASLALSRAAWRRAVLSVGILTSLVALGAFLAS